VNPIVDYGEIVIFAVLGLSSVLAVAVFIEKYIVFFQNRAKNVGDFMKRVTELLHDHRVEEALRYSRESKPHMYQRFSSYALTHYQAGHEGLSDLMEGKKIEIRAELDRRISILNTLGNNAPFIGLLGTVLGVIKAFYGLGTLGAVGAEVVMRSISSALIATAAGLAVAIPVVIANNYFSSKTKSIMLNIEVLSREIIASYNHRVRNAACNRDQIKN
jgi:biopolymer transport protein ExbB